MAPALRPASVLVLGALASVLALPAATPAQEGQGKYVAEASVRLTRLITTANKDGFKLQEDAFSFGGAWLKQGKKNWVTLYTVDLQEGMSYRFIAAGDDDALDVDLEVQDADGNVVARDVKTDPTAVVDYSPKTAGKYSVRIRLFESTNNVPCFCSAIMLSKKN
jgi:hypothetical protein